MMPFSYNIIMHNAGLVVAYNSDDAEMSRRLNQEAAKKQLNMEIFLKKMLFVTLNPAVIV
jgi:hypothetical protein